MNITPTVGRTILLWLTNPDGIAVRIGEPLCAQIAAVLPTGNLNIGFLDYQGCQRGMLDVPLVQHGETVPAGPYCAWMDYQVGQARAAAADEAGSLFEVGGAPNDSGRSIIEPLSPSTPSQDEEDAKNQSMRTALELMPIATSEPLTLRTAEDKPADVS